MADLFEQIIGDYLTGQGYLARLNVNYRKADGKQSGSDIDVLAFHPKDQKVIVGDCKSWQGGLWGDWMLAEKDKSAELQRKRFKAIFDHQWAQGLATKVDELFATHEFTYVIYCTKKRGKWEDLLKLKVAGNPIEVVELADIIRETERRVKDKSDESVEPTTLGRFVQLLRAAGIKLKLPATS